MINWNAVLGTIVGGLAVAAAVGIFKTVIWKRLAPSKKVVEPARDAGAAILVKGKIDGLTLERNRFHVKTAIKVDEKGEIRNLKANDNQFGKK
jgi:hypothetical protein